MPRRKTRTPGQRAGLDTEAVLAATVAVYRRQGLAALTMRAVAGELGVLPNTLYSHVNRKEELVDGIVDRLLADIPLPDCRCSWRSGLMDLFDASRRTLAAHAELMPVVLSRPSRGPNAHRLAETTLALLASGGVRGQKAVRALRILLVYTLGFAAQEAPRRLEDAETTRERHAVSRASFTHSAHARVRSSAASLASHPDDVTFRTGLGWLVDAIAQHAAG